MTSTPETRTTQAEVLTVFESNAGGVRNSQSLVLTAINFPTPGIRATQFEGLVVAKPSGSLKTTQAFALVALFRGGQHKLRAWTFNLDGHDFYLLRLGTNSTVVYDLTTSQWSKWTSHGQAYFRPHLGLNWLGQAKTTLNQGFSWNIVGGDDSSGQLWSLDPDTNYDQNTDGSTAVFTRTVTGAVAQRLRDAQPCGGVYLTASLGNPLTTAPTIDLLTSDNNGATWDDQGLVTVTTDPSQELAWIGLGLIKAPGRLFKLVDSGAISRISSFDMRP